MEWHTLDIYDFHAAATDEMHHGTECPVRNMLVVDGVKGSLLQQVYQVMRLYHEDTPRREYGLDTGYEILEFWNMRKGVGRGDSGCRPPMRDDLLCGFGAEEPYITVNS